MTLEHAKAIVDKELRRSGYSFVFRESKSTSSCYYKIEGSRDTSLMFRISDHNTNKNVLSFLVTEHQSEAQLVNFVDNRIRDFKKRHLKALLG